VQRRRTSLSASEARRIALAAQGFDRQRPASATDARHFRRALRSVALLQLDFVNVLLPAQFLVMWSRLGPYDRSRFEHFLYRSGEFTEQWAHEASVVPVSDWPLLGHRRRYFQPWKNSPLHNLPDKDQYLADILLQVREQGALTSHDLPPIAGPKRKAGDWHRSVPRWALEYHFGRGRLAVARRLPNFQRVYDLPERLIDDQHRARKMRKEDANRELLRQAAAALGLATLHDLADYYRMSPRDAAPRLRDLIEDGTLSAINVEGWSEPAYLAGSARLPRRIGGASLLSPFDPIVWYRPRVERLFVSPGRSAGCPRRFESRSAERDATRANSAPGNRNRRGAGRRRTGVRAASPCRLAAAGIDQGRISGPVRTVARQVDKGTVTRCCSDRPQ
jgi:uncharacterized protein YcaQ